MNHSHHPEGDHKADAKRWVDNFPKLLQPLDHPLLLLLPLVAVQLPHGRLLNFFIYADQPRKRENYFFSFSMIQ